MALDADRLAKGAEEAVAFSQQGKDVLSFREAARVWAVQQGDPVSWPVCQKAMSVLRHMFPETLSTENQTRPS